MELCLHIWHICRIIYLQNIEKLFFQKKSYKLDWKTLEKQNLDQVINSICMIAPFSLEEKQILLESKKIIDRKLNNYGNNFKTK